MCSAVMPAWTNSFSEGMRLMFTPGLPIGSAAIARRQGLPLKNAPTFWVVGNGRAAGLTLPAVSKSPKYLCAATGRYASL
jgi:hypothetical protein